MKERREAGEIDLRKAIVDDLSHCEVTAIAGHIKALCFDACGAWRSPLEVLALEFCPRCGVGLVCDGLDCRATVDRLLDADAQGPLAEMIFIGSHNAIPFFEPIHLDAACVA